jgi:hypothetical protein
MSSERHQASNVLQNRIGKFKQELLFFELIPVILLFVG